MKYILSLTFSLLLLSVSAFPQTTEQKDRLPQRPRPNICLNIPSWQKSYLNLGCISHVGELHGASLNLFTGNTQSDLKGVQLSGLISTSKGGTRGLQISGLANFTEKDTYGLMLSSFFNVTGSTLHGLQFSTVGNISKRSKGFSVSGLTNLVGESGNGLQISGLANISGKDQTGIALCGLMNVAASRLTGAQTAGIMNICGWEVTGCQLAGISNVGVQVTGLQLAGALNVAQGKLKGVQLGCSNIAGEVHGVQIGFLNICGKEVKGCQIGIINQSKDTTALKFGMVNVTPKTDIKFLFFGGNTSKFNIATQFKNRHTYSILGFGTHYLDMNRKFSGCLYYRTGLRYVFRPRWEISGDLGYFHIENFKNEDVDTPECMYSLQGRINLDFSFSKNFGLFTSTGYGVTRHYHKNKTYEKKPIFEFGIHIL